MANLVVTTSADIENPNDDLLSLREAIAAANADPDQSTITFASGAGDAFANDAVIRLTQGELQVTEALTIDGSSAGGELVITGDANDDDVTLAGTDVTDSSSLRSMLDDNSRVLNATADTHLIGLTITGGRTTGYNGFDNTIYSGGGIRSEADVVLTGVTLAGNSTTGGYGGGGGLFAAGAVTLTGSKVSGNFVQGYDSIGGGLQADGAVTITDSAITNNSAFGDYGVGGGVFSRAETTIIGSLITDNTAGAGGGVLSLGRLVVENSTVARNSTFDYFGYGGGLFGRDELTIVNSIITDNSTSTDSGNGAGVFSDGNLTIVGSTVSNNSAGGFLSSGGGAASYANATIINSTVSGNSASGFGGNGGGIYTVGATTLVSSTVTGNSVGDPQGFYTPLGGGVFSQGGINLVNSIVLGNATEMEANELFDENSQITFAGANIVGADSAAFDVSGFTGVTNANPTDVFALTEAIEDSPLVQAGVLAANGGLVETVALRSDPNNPALDAGDSSQLTESEIGIDFNGDGDLFDAILTDAAGNARVVDQIDVPDDGSSALDLGAVEVQNQVSAAPPATVVRIQTEDFESLGGAVEGYQVENRVIADEGQQLRLAGNTPTGTATLPLTTDLGIAAGLNDITVQVFDESDGESTLLLLLNGDLVGEVVFDFDTGSPNPSNESRRLVVFEGINIQPGDTLQLTGARDGNEPARIDFVEFSSTDDASPPPPPPPPAEPSIVSISPPTPDNVMESGDAGSTSLSFPVTFDTLATAPVELSFTVNINGDPQTLTQTIAPTGGAIVVEVDNDAVDNGAEVVSIDLTGVTGDAALGLASSATATVVEDDQATPPPPPPSPATVVRIQTEDFESLGGTVEGYQLENRAIADEGQQLRLAGNTPTGTAALPLIADLGIAAGLNDITVQVFDESDGESTLQLLLNGGLVGEVVFDFDTGSPNPSDETRRLVVFEGVNIQPGDTLQLAGARDGNEPARIDFVEFSSTDDASPPPPPPPPPTESPVVSIAAPTPDSVVESGDDGATPLSFPVTFDRLPTAPVELSFTVDLNGDLQALTQTIDPTGGAIVVEVANDAINNGSEVVSIELTGVTGDAALGLASSATATVTEDDEVTPPPPPPPPPPPSPSTVVRIQTEDFESLGGTVDGYQVENRVIADEGQQLRLAGNTPTGTATLPLATDLGIAAGLNDITVQVFDESDGESTLQLLLNGGLVGEVVFDFDTGSPNPSDETRRLVVFEGVNIQPGDTLQLAGARDGNEPARIDFVEFAAVTSTVTTQGSLFGNASPQSFVQDLSSDTFSSSLFESSTMQMEMAQTSLTLGATAAPNTAQEPMVQVTSLAFDQEENEFESTITLIDDGL